MSSSYYVRFEARSHFFVCCWDAPFERNFASIRRGFQEAILLGVLHFVVEVDDVFVGIVFSVVLSNLVVRLVIATMGFDAGPFVYQSPDFL